MLYAHAENSISQRMTVKLVADLKEQHPQLHGQLYILSYTVNSHPPLDMHLIMLLTTTQKNT